MLLAPSGVGGYPAYKPRGRVNGGPQTASSFYIYPPTFLSALLVYNMTVDAEPAMPKPPSNLLFKVFDFFFNENRKKDESTPLLNGNEPEHIKEKTLYYLAYGSNLSSATFRGRRGIKPLSATNVLCPGKVLTFDLDGIPYWEPCFANIKDAPPREQEKIRDIISAAESPEKAMQQYVSELEQLAASGGGEIWENALVGVVYEVTESDFATIIRTEGAGIGYKDIEVDCLVLQPSDEKGNVFPATTIRAHTLCAPPGRQCSMSPAQPSPRYLNILVGGANEHSLPRAYINYLSSLPGYRYTRWQLKVGGYLFLINWVIPMALVFQLRSMVIDKVTGRSPRWMQKLETGFWLLVWFTYKAFYKPLWGDGQRSTGDESV